jgi:hypothetical protein
MNIFNNENKMRFTQIAEAREKGKSLEGENALIARVMDNHPEFDLFWPLGDLAALPQEVGDSVVNPFVHTALHLVVEKQVESLSPQETAAALYHLEKSGCTRHEALHQILTIYAENYFYTFRRGEAFEETVYIEMLKELREKNAS